MENNKPLLGYMADMILEDSKKLGTLRLCYRFL